MSGESGDKGAAFDHTPVPGQGKEELPADQRVGNPLEEGDKILGKFETQEDLVKAYQELQKKMGGEETDPPVTDPLKKEDPPVENKDGLIKKAADKDIDVEALNKEFGDTGELSQETMDTLTKRGIPQEMVEAYIAGQQALATNAIASLAEVAGGEEGLARTLEWAGDNLSDAEIDAYNEAMQAGNVGMTTTLLRGIVAAYTADVGEAPKSITGESATPSGTKPFANAAEQQHAQADPRYKTDPAYRDSVIARIAASM